MALNADAVTTRVRGGRTSLLVICWVPPIIHSRLFESQLCQSDRCQEMTQNSANPRMQTTVIPNHLPGSRRLIYGQPVHSPTGYALVV